jgi:3-isopropylmalate/(R)-2-methylmalate dehydratase small subunit
MEVAASVILAAGIKAVLAESFARTFFRNAINNGLIPIEWETGTIREGEGLIVEISGAVLTVENRTAQARDSAATPLTGIAAEILESGGLVPYLRARGKFNHGSLRGDE